jgi:uncharacterized lipoprotein YajG
MKKFLLPLGLVSLLLLTGCVTGRRSIALNVPTLAVSTAAKGAFHIAGVVDNRAFQNKPSDPSTPSVDGDVTALSAEQKATMIGRQRNTYGHAMGDIALPAGDSVIQRTRLLLEQGLKHRGYEISPDPSAPYSASVSIDEFWAWSTPGFLSLPFEARVYCTVILKKASDQSTVIVKGYGINHGQVASDGNWQLAYDAAFQDFLNKLDAELTKAGF